MKRTLLLMKLNFVLLLAFSNFVFSQVAEEPVNFQNPEAGTENQPFEIQSLNNLYWLSQNPLQWDKHYIQTSNIDATETNTWFSGAGWMPIGNPTTYFTGTYDGNFHSISNLFIDRGTTEYIGLFGTTDGAVILNLDLLNVSIKGRHYVGALAGFPHNNTKIIFCSSSGNVTSVGPGIGTDKVIYTGGLVGLLSTASLLNSYSSAVVAGNGSCVGGLVGMAANSAVVSHCFSTGSASGTKFIGGLIGHTNPSAISNCYTSASSSGESYIGGFTGWNRGNITNSYATGSVSGSTTSAIRGFIAHVYLGSDAGNYFNTETTGQTTSAGNAAGRTTEEMTWTAASNTYVSWNFESIWVIQNGMNNGYPFLRWEGAPKITTDLVKDVLVQTVIAEGSIVALGLADITQHGHCWSLTPQPDLLNCLDKSELGNATNAVSYESVLTGLDPGTTYYVRAYATNEYGTSYGRQLVFTTRKGELTVLNAVAADKTYDRTNEAILSEAVLEGVLDDDDVELDELTAFFSQIEAGENIPVEAAITLKGNDAEKYVLIQPAGLTANITAKELTVGGSFTVENKSSDGTKTATIVSNSLTLEGIISPDVVELTNVVAEFAQPESGTNIQVSITNAQLSGADAHNYQLDLAGSPTTTADISSPTSIWEPENKIVRVYPNPFSESIYLENSGEFSTVRLVDITGKVVLNDKISGKGVIPATQLQEGLYFLMIETPDGHIETFKMIKQK